MRTNGFVNEYFCERVFLKLNVFVNEHLYRQAFTDADIPLLAAKAKSLPQNMSYNLLQVPING